MMNLRNISVAYGSHEAVKDVSASAKAGQLIALLGPNGSGKSSLLKAIADLVPHEGQFELEIEFTDRISRARQIAYLAQQRIGPPLTSIRDIIALGRVPHHGRLSRLTPEDTMIVDGVIEKLDLGTDQHRPFGQLSGGEQARVLLGRALAVSAPILLADEPIASLDPHFQLQILDILRTEAKGGTLVITALHDLSLAECYADEIWVMDRGQLKAQGPANEALSVDTLRDVFGVKRVTGSRFSAAD